MNRSARRLCIPPIEDEKVMEALLNLCALRPTDPTADQGARYLRPFIFAYDPQFHSCQELQAADHCFTVGAYFTMGLTPQRSSRNRISPACPGGVVKQSGRELCREFAGGAIAEEKAATKSFADGERRYIEEVGAMNTL